MSPVTPANPAFPNTSWGLVRAARQTTDGQLALSALCRRYWFPIYASLRRQGSSPSDAEDLTQGFFLHLIERDTVSRADADRGRFRDFLLGALRWFIANELERRNARKRGAGTFVAVDIAEVESWLEMGGSSADSLELQFDRQWANTLIRNALGELRIEYAAHRQERMFTALRPYLTPGIQLPSYAALAEQLSSSEGAIKVAVHRLRTRFRDVLRNEVAATVSSAREVDEELAHFRAVLSVDAAEGAR